MLRACDSTVFSRIAEELQWNDVLQFSSTCHQLRDVFYEKNYDKYFIFYHQVVSYEWLFRDIRDLALYDGNNYRITGIESFYKRDAFFPETSWSVSRGMPQTKRKNIVWAKKGHRRPVAWLVDRIRKKEEEIIKLRGRLNTAIHRLDEDWRRLVEDVSRNVKLLDEMEGK